MRRCTSAGTGDARSAARGIANGRQIPDGAVVARHLGLARRHISRDQGRSPEPLGDALRA